MFPSYISDTTLFRIVAFGLLLPVGVLLLGVLIRGACLLYDSFAGPAAPPERPKPPPMPSLEPPTEPTDAEFAFAGTKGTTPRRSIAKPPERTPLTVPSLGPACGIALASVVANGLFVLVVVLIFQAVFEAELAKVAEVPNPEVPTGTKVRVKPWPAGLFEAMVGSGIVVMVVTLTAHMLLQKRMLPATFGQAIRVTVLQVLFVLAVGVVVSVPVMIAMVLMRR